MICSVCNIEFDSPNLKLTTPCLIKDILERVYSCEHYSNKDYIFEFVKISSYWFPQDYLKYKCQSMEYLHKSDTRGWSWEVVYVKSQGLGVVLLNLVNGAPVIITMYENTKNNYWKTNRDRNIKVRAGHSREYQ